MALVGLSGTNMGLMNPDYEEATIMTQGEGVGATNWTTVLDSVLKAAPSVITATQRQPSVQSYQPTYQTPTASSTGISTNTLLMIGGVGILAFLLLRKK